MSRSARHLSLGLLFSESLHALTLNNHGMLQELVTEGSAPELNDLTLERALMARLAAPPPTYPQWPVHYLVGCYVRASGV